MDEVTVVYLPKFFVVEVLYKKVKHLVVFLLLIFLYDLAFDWLFVSRCDGIINNIARFMFLGN